LQAIEDGQTEKLISPIYAQGFVRQYAAFLGLDGDSIIAEHAEIFKKPIQQDFAYGIGTLETRGTPGGGIKWLPNALWLIATLFVGVLAYFIAKSLSLL
jgi:cytoskeletal protein RodZ